MAAASDTKGKEGKGGTSRAAQSEILKLATRVVEEFGPATASEIAAMVCKKNAKMKGKEFNVAFAVRAAERRGEVFKKSSDRPARYSLRPVKQEKAAPSKPEGDEVKPDPKPQGSRKRAAAPAAA